jgi:hypothetical protein
MCSPDCRQATVRVTLPRLVARDMLVAGLRGADDG